MGTMQFFGEPWDMPALDDAEQVPTPVGQACVSPCGELIAEGEQGILIPGIVEGPMGAPIPKMVAFHRECWIRNVIGSFDHLEGRCSCVRSGQLGGDEERGEENWREQGRQTMAWLEEHRDSVSIACVAEDG